MASVAIPAASGSMMWPEESGPMCLDSAPDMTVKVWRITSISSGSMVARSVQDRNSGA